MTMNSVGNMRVVGEKRDISYDATWSFFESRGRAADPAVPQTATMYQDRDLALQRDALERDTVLPSLGLHGHERVLDVGCGYGRWARILATRVARYLGVDFSAELLALAARLELPNCRFQRLAAQEIRPETLDEPPPFDCLLCSGILIYLNDADVEQLATVLGEMAAGKARLYLREPMANEKRLTLDCFPSVELRCEYSAIYRTLDECERLFGGPLVAAGFRRVVQRPLFPVELCNRKETAQYIEIWEKAQ